MAFVKAQLISTTLVLLGALACASSADNSAKPEGEKSELASLADVATGDTPPPTQEEIEEKATVLAQDWFYGPGIGQTMLNVGTSVLFPPYAVYVLGRAGLSAAGIEAPAVTDALPEPARKGVNEVYDTMISAPGRLNAEVAGEKFRGN